MKVILYASVLNLVVVTAAAGGDPFAPKASSDEYILARDQKTQTQIPDEHSSSDGVTIHAESLANGTVTILLINNSDQPILFTGTGIDSPQYRLQIPWKGGAWADAGFLWWCGTGVYLPQLLSKRCCRFEVTSKEPTLRVGLDYWVVGASGERTTNTVWTQSINMKKG